MKTGLIVFAPAQAEHIDDWTRARILGMDADEVRLATTEAELAHGLWEVRARGAARVRYVWADWNASQRAWSPRCEPRHLCG